MTAEPRCWGGGGVSHPSQLTTGLVIKSVTTSPTLAGERMLFILQVSILSEQIYSLRISYFWGLGGEAPANTCYLYICMYTLLIHLHIYAVFYTIHLTKMYFRQLCEPPNPTVIPHSPVAPSSSPNPSDCREKWRDLIAQDEA